MQGTARFIVGCVFVVCLCGKSSEIIWFPQEGILFSYAQSARKMEENKAKVLNKLSYAPAERRERN